MWRARSRSRCSSTYLHPPSARGRPENGVPMIGNAFAFTLETAEQFATEALDLDLDEEEDEEDSSVNEWEEEEDSEVEEEEDSESEEEEDGGLEEDGSDDCRYEVVEKVYYR